MKDRPALLLLAAVLLALAWPRGLPAQEPAGDKPRLRFACLADVQYADMPTIGTRRFPEALGKLGKAIGFLNQQDVVFVIDLGDMADGKDLDATIAAYAPLEKERFHVIGNHDLGALGETAALKKLGLEAINYTFVRGGYRFVVVNSFDLSIYSGEPAKKRRAAEILAGDGSLRAWNGALSAELLAWMERQFQEARQKGEKAIVCSHVPALGQASSAENSLWNPQPVLDLLKRNNDVVVLWLSGHYHGGGYAQKDGIHHLTLPAVCDAPQDGNAFAVISAYPDKLVIEGHGTVPSSVLELSGRTDTGSSPGVTP